MGKVESLYLSFWEVKAMRVDVEPSESHLFDVAMNFTSRLYLEGKTKEKVTWQLLNELRARYFGEYWGESLLTCPHRDASTQDSKQLFYSVDAVTLPLLWLRTMQTSDKAKSGLYDGKYNVVWCSTVQDTACAYPVTFIKVLNDMERLLRNVK